MTAQPTPVDGTSSKGALAEPTDQAAQSVTPEQGKGENRETIRRTVRSD